MNNLRKLVRDSKAEKRRKNMANIVLDLKYQASEDDIRYSLDPSVTEIHAENRMIDLRHAEA